MARSMAKFQMKRQPDDPTAVSRPGGVNHVCNARRTTGRGSESRPLADKRFGGIADRMCQGGLKQGVLSIGELGRPVAK